MKIPELLYKSLLGFSIGLCFSTAYFCQIFLSFEYKLEVIIMDSK